MSWLEGRKAPTLSFGEVREPVLYPPCGILRDSGPRPRRGSPTGPRPCQVGLASTPTPLEKHKFSSLHFLFSSFVLAPLFLFRSVLARASLSSSLILPSGVRTICISFLFFTLRTTSISFLFYPPERRRLPSSVYPFDSLPPSPFPSPITSSPLSVSRLPIPTRLLLPHLRHLLLLLFVPRCLHAFLFSLYHPDCPSPHI